MIDAHARQPLEPLHAAGRRVVVGVLLLGVLAVIARFSRPAALLALARWNLGNPNAEAFVFQVLSELRPAMIRSTEDGGRRSAYPARILGTYSCGGTRSVILDAGDTGHRFLDHNLDLAATLRGGGPQYAPADRDGDERRDWEFLVYANITPRRDSFQWQWANAYAVVKLGSERHRLLAIIGLNPTTRAPVLALPVWTNSDQDERHELEWFRYARTATGFLRTTSAFKLRWAAPGQLEPEGELPAGYALWLPPVGNEVSFGSEELLDDVIRRALGD